MSAWSWQMAAQRAAAWAECNRLYAQAPPPPPPPPLASSSGSSDSGSDVERERSSAPNSPQSLTSPFAARPAPVNAESERRLEDMRLQLQKSSLFRGARRRWKDVQLASMLRAVIKVEDSDHEAVASPPMAAPVTPTRATRSSLPDGGLNQVQRLALRGHATLDQVATDLLSPPRPTRAVKLEIKEEKSLPRRPRRGGRRAGRTRASGALPTKKHKKVEKFVIPAWRKCKSKRAGKGKNKDLPRMGKGLSKGKGKGKNVQFVRVPLPPPRRFPVPWPSSAPSISHPKPSSRPRPSCSVTLHFHA